MSGRSAHSSGLGSSGRSTHIQPANTLAVLGFPHKPGKDLNSIENQAHPSSQRIAVFNRCRRFFSCITLCISPVSATVRAHGLDDSSGASQPIIDEGIPAQGAPQASISILPSSGEREDASHSVVHEHAASMERCSTSDCRGSTRSSPLPCPGHNRRPQMGLGCHLQEPSCERDVDRPGEVMARKRPIRRPMVPQLDLGMVLRALCGAPFEPVQSVSMDMLSYKAALLLSLCSAKRIGDIHVLSVYPSCIQFTLDDSKVVLRPNLSYIPKVPALSYKAMMYELSSLSPPRSLWLNSSVYTIYALCARCAYTLTARERCGRQTNCSSASPTQLGGKYCLNNASLTG